MEREGAYGDSAAPGVCTTEAWGEQRSNCRATATNAPRGCRGLMSEGRFDVGRALDTRSVFSSQ